MSSIQSQPLSEADLTVIKDYFGQVAISFLLYGVYATFSLTAICLVLLKKASGSNITTVLPFLTGLMLLTSLVSTVCNLELLIVQLPSLSFNPPDSEKLKTVLERMDIVQTFVDRLNYIISDGIVVWRAWIMFPESRAVKLTLLFCMVGSLAAGFVDAGLDAAQTVTNPDSESPKINILILGLPLLFTNIIATLLIGQKTWCHYQDVKKNLSNSGTSSSRVQKVLLLLVESGSVYCIFWVVYIIISSKYESTSTILECWGAAAPELSALYPVLIIVIAAAENAKPATIEEMSLSQSIRFASGQASGAEEHGPVTESQFNAPATTTSEAEHTGEN